MIPVIPRSFFNRSQDLQNMEISNNNTSDTHRAESSFHGGRIARAKSCVIGYASVTTVSSSAVRTGAKSDRMKFYGTLCSIPRDMRRNYRSVVVAADKAHPPVSLSIRSPDSGFSRSGSMQTCLESNFHRSVPARGTPLEPRDGGSEFYCSERFSRVRQGHAVNRRNVRNRTNTLTTLSVAGSSVILSDYDSSLRLCQSCNTFYEVASTATCLPYQEPDVPTTICNVFWKLYLTLSPFVCGGVAVEFGSLWPSEPTLLDSLLLETCSTSSSLVQTLSRDAVLCGPLHILKALLNLNIISINQTFDNGFSLLHVACIAQNSSAVTYLTKAGIDATIRDNQGCTAAQVCCSPHIYALLPNAYLASSVPPKVKRSTPTMLEKQTIFEMARNPEDTERLLTKLQILKFDVNKQMDNSGDLIIHVVIKEGLAQIPLLLLLVRLFNADVNIHNKSGLTCLMLASSMGATVLVDVLLCVLGADPNLRCHEKRWTALHYASYEQHLETIDVLLKRGSDFNVEDENGARADDVAMRCGAHDCRDAIEKKRQELIQRMKTIVKGNEVEAVKRLRDADLFIVNNTGHTLIMWAVKQDSLDILEFLLNQTNLQQTPGNEKAKKERPSLINAQAQKTLRTALAMAVIHRRKDAVQLLFRFGANPSIHDVQKLLPLHHAIINRDIEMVDTLLQHTSALTGLKKALDLSENDEITVKLKSAMNRRQNLIVNHELFEHSVSGNTNRLFCVLEEGDDVNPVTGVGDWPLYLAAVNGHLDVIKLLMERGGDFWSVHSSDGNTVLHVSCANSHEEIIEYLLMTYRATTAPGATTPEGRLSALLTEHLNLLNFKGRTPLMLAAETGNIDLVRLLLDHGASTSVLTPDGQLYRCDQFDGVQHILEQHHKRHCVEVFEAIANKKGGYQRLKDLFFPNHDHNLRHPSTGDSPLMTASRLGRIDVLRHLLGSASYTLFRQPGPRESSEAETTVGGLVIISDDDFIDGWDEHPVTPTDAAAAAADVGNGKLKDTRTAADGLLERGEENGDNVATVDENLSALLEGMNSVCQVNPVLSGNKISQTCAVNTFDKCTVYHRAIESGDSVVMLHCLLEGADQSAVNMQDMRGFSPLHLAVQLNRKKVVQKLTQLRYVDLNCRALDGALPEDLTTNKTIKSLVLRARSQQDVTASVLMVRDGLCDPLPTASQVLTEASATPLTRSTLNGSTIGLPSSRRTVLYQTCCIHKTREISHTGR